VCVCVCVCVCIETWEYDFFCSIAMQSYPDTMLKVIYRDKVITGTSWIPLVSYCTWVSYVNRQNLLWVWMSMQHWALRLHLGPVKGCKYYYGKNVIKFNVSLGNSYRRLSKLILQCILVTLNLLFNLHLQKNYQKCKSVHYKVNFTMYKQCSRSEM